MTRRRGRAGRAAALVVAATLVAGAGCGGGDETGGDPIATPSDEETSYRDNPCARAGAERRKRFHVTDEGFKPPRVVVQAGGPITFVNCGKKTHTVTKMGGPGDDFDRTLEPREELDHTFAVVGTHRIGDRRNPDAKMTIEVSGAPGEPQE